MPYKNSPLPVSGGLGDGPEIRRARLRDLLRKTRRTQALVPPNPPPRYDEVFAKGQQWLDQLATGQEEL